MSLQKVQCSIPLALKHKNCGISSLSTSHFFSINQPKKTACVIILSIPA